MKVKIGHMACESCGEKVVVKQNELETLSYRCDECDAAPYARKGTAQHGIWLKKTKPVEGAAVAPPPTKKAVQEPPTAEIKNSNPFTQWG